MVAVPVSTALLLAATVPTAAAFTDASTVTSGTITADSVATVPTTPSPSAMMANRLLRSAM